MTTVKRSSLIVERELDPYSLNATDQQRCNITLNLIFDIGAPSKCGHEFTSLVVGNKLYHPLTWVPSRFGILISY